MLSGIPKTTLSFRYLLGELMELRKSVMVYYIERIQISISKGEKHVGQSAG